MMRNAGILRKIPDNNDLYLTIDGSRLKVKGDDIPRILAGSPRGVFDLKRQRAGIIKRWNRQNSPDLIEIQVFNLIFSVSFTKFQNVWTGVSPYCGIFERIPNSWKGFEGVRC